MYLDFDVLMAFGVIMACDIIMACDVIVIVHAVIDSNNHSGFERPNSTELQSIKVLKL